MKKIIYENKEKTLYFKKKISKIFIEQNRLSNVNFEWYYIDKNYLKKENKKIVPFIENAIYDLEEKFVKNYFKNKNVYFFIFDESNLDKSLIRLDKQNIDLLDLYEEIHYFNFLMFTDNFEIMCYNDNDTHHYWIGNEVDLKDLFKDYTNIFIEQFKKFIFENNDIYPYEACRDFYIYYNNFLL